MAWVAALVMTVMLPIGVVALVLGAFGIKTQPFPTAIIPATLCILVGGGFVLGFIGCWWMILRPREWEIAVVGDLVRWGDVKRPDCQRRVLLSDINRIEGQYDSEFHRSRVELADGSWVTLPEHILLTRQDAEQCVEAIRKVRPEIASQFYGSSGEARPSITDDNYMT
jgi:hypothetical protein